MRYPLILLLGFCTALAPAMAEIYRWTDELGNVIYSDTPAEGSEKVELNETTIVPAQSSQAVKQPSARAGPTAFEGYEVVSIVSPGNEETLRNVQGVRVAVKIKPPLQIESGHLVQLYFDGNAYGEASAVGQFTLEEVERGTHHLAAAVVDSAGIELKRSATSVFFTHRHSVLHPAPANPSPR